MTTYVFRLSLVLEGISVPFVVSIWRNICVRYDHICVPLVVSIWRNICVRYDHICVPFVVSIWRNICVRYDHICVPFVIITIPSFLHACLSTVFVTRKARRVSLVEQDLPTLPEHPISPPVFSKVRNAKSLDFSRPLFPLLSLFLWP